MQGDVLDRDRLLQSLDGCDSVFHLAANADVRHGFDQPTLDLEQNTIATSVVLEAMRAAGVAAHRLLVHRLGLRRARGVPHTGDVPVPGADVALRRVEARGEGLIQAYANGYGYVGIIFRFVSILGERYTHGHVFDFCRSLRQDPSRLRVLGDGRQEKSYLYVGDCVSAMTLAMNQQLDPGALRVYNLGTDETIVVDDSIATITAHLGVTPELEYTGGLRGWPGDSPLIHLDCTRVRSLGWEPTVSIRDAIRRTVDWLEQNPHVLEERVAA